MNVETLKISTVTQKESKNNNMQTDTDASFAKELESIKNVNSDKSKDVSSENIEEQKNITPQKEDKAITKEKEDSAVKESEPTEDVSEKNDESSKIDGNKTSLEEINNKLENKTDADVKQFSAEKSELKPNIKVNIFEEKNDGSSLNKIPENEPEKLSDALNGLQGVFEKIADKQKEKLVSKEDVGINNKKDENNEDETLIDNNMNVNDAQDKINLQMGNMNFNNNNGGQPFSEYVNSAKDETLRVSAKDLEEEKEILSTMDENIAMANRNIVINKSAQKVQKPGETTKPELKVQEAQQNEVETKVKTVVNNEGIKKVDKQTNITVETVIKFDNVVMTKEDVDFFVNLVENGSTEINNTQNVRAAHVSKTLADLLAKSMNENKPVRIDFDNDISVIIKVGRDGKISADFLPSSQIAEAYLRDNLPILRQRFEDKNIEYDELNQRRQQKQDNEKENRKKGSKNE